MTGKLTLSVNADKLNPLGSIFFGHLQHLAIAMITLEICKIYEKENKSYKLNSIHGVMAQLKKMNQISFDPGKFENFVNIYHGSPIEGDHITLLSKTVEGVFDQYKLELDCFKTARDKKIAHSEYDIENKDLPSYDLMEKLFDFGAEFYDLISSVFEDLAPVRIKKERRVKGSLLKILREMGMQNLIEDMT